jgi:hypothetical protein
VVNGHRLTPEEIAHLLAPGLATAAAIWVRPISTYVRHETHDGGVIRFV